MDSDISAGSTATGSNEITWRHQRRYSPIQDRAGVKAAEQMTFPPVTERVSQEVDAFQPAFADEREIMRATYQGDDRCQLACPGCYTRDVLQITSAVAAREGRRKVAPAGEFAAHVDALGPGMQDVYVIGAEPTMDPEGTAAKLAYARERGWPQQVITHGAVSVERFESTFGEALDSGTVYMMIVSLDSMDPEVNNRLRGRPYAHARTLQIIRHCVQREAPLKVQMTVWPLNYPTILRSVEELFALGVRAFSFHSGTLEGATDDEADRAGLMPVDALAWRALAEQLLAFRDAHREDLRFFGLPFLYFTEEELRSHVIGDDRLTSRYLRHMDAVEAGKPSVKPVQACPGIDVPQVYVWANSGLAGRGTMSLCSIDRDPVADAYADYDPDAKRWRVRQDPARNQMKHMIDSPHLCPATPYATRSHTDRVITEAGPLYHACRYIASNQVPVDVAQFGYQTYADALAFYTAFNQVLNTRPGPAEGEEYPITWIRRVIEGIVPLAERAHALTDALAAPTRSSR